MSTIIFMSTENSYNYPNILMVMFDCKPPIQLEGQYQTMKNFDENV